MHSFGVVVCSLSLTLGADPLPPAQPGGQAMIESYLARQARDLDGGFLKGVTSAADWQRRRPDLKRQYLEMLGLWPLPARTPLAAQTTGIVRRSGFRVEKVHFQSIPHLYVTANLYLPEKIPGKLPAILYVCGHASGGRNGSKTRFEHHGIWFATHGYACLIIDTLQLGEIAGIHHGTYRYDRWWWQAAGYTPAGVECWNGIRALDYLQGRPEVDPDRLAVTGISGGGAATFWIAAADERVKVAVPVSGMSDLEDYVGHKVINGHCDCMLLVNTYRWPWTTIAALVAPRPMLFCNSDHDTLFPMAGNRRIIRRLKQIDTLLGHPERVEELVVPGGHADKPELRLAAYRWINRYLKHDDRPVHEPLVAPIPADQLRVFPGRLPADERNTRIDETFVARASTDVPDSKTWPRWRQQKLDELKRLCFGAWPAAYPRPARAETGGAAAGLHHLTTEPGIEVSYRVLPRTAAPSPPDRPACTLVVLNPDESLDRLPRWMAGWTSAGETVVLLAPRGQADHAWDDRPPHYVRRAMAILGETPDSGRVWDAMSLVGQHPDLAGPGTRWRIAGRGAAGVLGAYAAVFEPRIQAVVVVDPPRSHRDGPIFLNVLRVLDIPQAFGLLAPRPLRLIGPPASAFDATARAYAAAGRPQALQRESRPPPASQARTVPSR